MRAVMGFAYTSAGHDGDASRACHGWRHPGMRWAPLQGIADAVGTPCYVYSSATSTSRGCAAAGARHDAAAIHYALKANSTLAVIRHLRGWREGDANSVGEIEWRSGRIHPDELVFTGVGKSLTNSTAPSASVSA